MTNEELVQQVNDFLRVGRLKESRDLIDGELEARGSGVTEGMLVIVAEYNRLGLPQVTKLTPPRARALRARLKEHPRGEGFWREFFARVSRSDFLMGRSRPSWRANFDWLMKPANMQKVLEGNYDPPRTSGLSASDEAAFAMSGPA